MATADAAVATIMEKNIAVVAADMAMAPAAVAEAKDTKPSDRLLTATSPLGDTRKVICNTPLNSVASPVI